MRSYTTFVTSTSILEELNKCAVRQTNKTKKKKKKKEAGRTGRENVTNVLVTSETQQDWFWALSWSFQEISISKSRSDLKAHPMNTYLAISYWKSPRVVISIMKHDCYITSCLLVINFCSSRRNDDNYKGRAVVEWKIWRIDDSINSHTLVTCLGESPVQWWEHRIWVRKALHSYFLAVWHWGSRLTSLSFHFDIRNKVRMNLKRDKTQSWEHDMCFKKW